MRSEEMFFGRYSGLKSRGRKGIAANPWKYRKLKPSSYSGRRGCFFLAVGAAVAGKAQVPVVAEHGAEKKAGDFIAAGAHRTAVIGSPERDFFLADVAFFPRHEALLKN
jgi:hypothetical protein